MAAEGPVAVAAGACEEVDCYDGICMHGDL